MHGAEKLMLIMMTMMMMMMMLWTCNILSRKLMSCATMIMSLDMRAMILIKVRFQVASSVIFWSISLSFLNISWYEDFELGPWPTMHLSSF